MEHESCTLVIHKWAAGLACGYDIIISTILLVFFLRPLVLLNHLKETRYRDTKKNLPRFWREETINGRRIVSIDPNVVHCDRIKLTFSFDACTVLIISI